MSADDHHRIGSVTKTLTGEAVLLLVDEGKIGPQGAVTEDTGILGYRRREPRARRRRACGRVRQNGKPRCYNFNPDPERGGREQLKERKNRRALPYRLEQCGYCPVRNDFAKDGLWKINDARQAVYAQTTLPIRARRI
jgi:hypothetical protein